MKWIEEAAEKIAAAIDEYVEQDMLMESLPYPDIAAIIDTCYNESPDVKVQNEAVREKLEAIIKSEMFVTPSTRKLATEALALMEGKAVREEGTNG